MRKIYFIGAFAFLAATWIVAGPPVEFRNDPQPAEWKIEEINNGLPYHWETGQVHVVAWKIIEEDRPEKKIRRAPCILVLKRMDKSEEPKVKAWLLTTLFHQPDNKLRPWKSCWIRPRPVLPGEKLPVRTTAQTSGHQFYADKPSDEEIGVFLRESGWTVSLGKRTAINSKGKFTYVSSVHAGAVDPVLWEKLFGRPVSGTLFPELRKLPAAE